MRTITRSCSITASPGAPWRMSRAGWISGGALMIRGSPSTTSVSLEKACMLSRVRVLARFFSSTFSRFGSTWLRSVSTTFSTS